MHGMYTPPTCVVETDAGCKLIYDMAVCHHIVETDGGTEILHDVSPPPTTEFERVTLMTMRNVAYNMCDIHVHHQRNIHTHATMDVV
ncbi:unnamed protein product, partial [marine sediment metagenome]